MILVLLGEFIERLAHRGNPLAIGLRHVRHVVVPVLAVLLILRQLAGMSSDTLSVRIVETLFWVTVIYTGLTLLSNLRQIARIDPTQEGPGIVRCAGCFRRTAFKTGDSS